MNWKVRFKNKYFWTAIIPAILLLVQKVLLLIGIEFDFTQLQALILDVVEAAFLVLAILGIVTDMTTDGIGDSKRAMTYTEPYKDEEK